MSGTHNGLNYVVVDLSYISIIGPAIGFSGVVTIPQRYILSLKIYKKKRLLSLRSKKR